MSFLNFQCSGVRIEDPYTEDVFYVYLDRERPLPVTLDDAYGDGFLVISLQDSKFAQWYLNIANQEYSGSLYQMQRILYDWAVSENYSWTVPQLAHLTPN